MILSWLAWISVVCGSVMIGQGIVSAIPTRSVLGASIVTFAMTLRTYAPLSPLDGDRRPLTTDERLWGATWTVLAGTAAASLLLAIWWAHRTGERRWTTPGLRRHLVMLGGAAVLSATLLRVVLALPGTNLRPSVDFLNDYGGDTRVLVYQLVFAAWLGGPVGALGLMTLIYQRGVTRWITTAGCAFGAYWAVWKAAGALVRYITGDAIAWESPVSVTVGTMSLVLVVLGLLIGACGSAIRRARQLRVYASARRADDFRHYVLGRSAA